MDYMMNDFQPIYLCSRNHNEVVAGVFFTHHRLHGLTRMKNLFHPDGVNNKSMGLLQFSDENLIIGVNL